MLKTILGKKLKSKGSKVWGIICHGCQNADKRQSLFILISHFNIGRKKKTRDFLSFASQWLKRNSGKRQIEAPALRVKVLGSFAINLISYLKDWYPWRPEPGPHHPTLSQGAVDWPHVCLTTWNDVLEIVSYDSSVYSNLFCPLVLLIKQHCTKDSLWTQRRSICARGISNF